MSCWPAHSIRLRLGSVKKFRDSAFAIGGPIKRDTALVLRVGSRGRDAAVCRDGVLVEQAHRSRRRSWYEPDLTGRR